MTGRTIEELVVGDTAEITKQITAETIREFVETTGDDNPIHSDAAFAATTRFGQIIAPGILTGGLISAVIGTRLPGPGTIYLSQAFRFLRPVYIGDTITARVEVTDVVRERNRLSLRTVCLNQRGEPVLEGEAWIMPSRQHIEYEAPEHRPGAWAMAYAPATLAMQAMSFWATSGLTFAAELLKLWEARPAARS
ncbi:MAG TPA: MaoC family dehydratase [Methylomirabilota bacterium]|jgi:acyl dehydratase|nr:MaoC family dehydratase [Methylomirabilota bacterium]